MTIKQLFDTLDFSSYDKIIVHWPMEDVSKDGEKDYHDVTFQYADPCIELFGHINIMTMEETSVYDGGDASLFMNTDVNNNIVVHIYIKREDVVRANN